MDLTKTVIDIADIYAGGQAISVLEGGYNLRGLSKAVMAHVATLRTLAKPTGPI